MLPKIVLNSFRSEIGLNILFIVWLLIGNEIQLQFY